MLKTAITAAITLAATAAPALAADTRSFTRNGETFVYSKVATGDQVVVDGRNTNSGETFHLVIAGTRVTGVANGQPISFVVPAGTTVATLISAR